MQLCHVLWTEVLVRFAFPSSNFVWLTFSIFLMGLSCHTVTKLHWRQVLKAFAPFTMLHNVSYLVIQGNYIGLFLTNPSPCHPVTLSDQCCSLGFLLGTEPLGFFFFFLYKDRLCAFFLSSLLLFHKVLKIWDNISQCNKLGRMKFNTSNWFEKSLTYLTSLYCSFPIRIWEFGVLYWYLLDQSLLTVGFF